MNVMLALLGLGFVVGLSGAMIPGPLLVYTVNESLKKGRWTGLLVILGHMIVETIIFALIALGITKFISSPVFVSAVSIVGGIALMGMGVKSMLELKSEIRFDEKDAGHGLVIGGIIFTLFNPSFPLWWVTAGTRLLLEGLNRFGFQGMLLVFLGHWAADMGWFVLVSITASHGSRYLFERNWYRRVRMVLSAMLLLIGAYFIASVY
ncbi:MAG: LysE family transporter [Candidatus Altiarchaeota archaeon]